MTLFDIVPIENHGMSVITAIILIITGTGVSIGTGIFLKWIVDRFDKHDDRLHEQDKILANVIETNTEARIASTKMQGDIYATRLVVDRIDHSMSDIAKTNTEVLKSYIKR